MFSVEDLLVSHGYKVSKSTLASYQHRTDGYQHQAADSRAANGILNGFQPDSELVAANPTQTKGLFGDHEKNSVNKRRQISAAGYPRSSQSSDSSHTSEVGYVPNLHFPSHGKNNAPLCSPPLVLAFLSFFMLTLHLQRLLYLAKSIW